MSNDSPNTKPSIIEPEKLITLINQTAKIPLSILAKLIPTLPRKIYNSDASQELIRKIIQSNKNLQDLLNHYLALFPSAKTTATELSSQQETTESLQSGKISDVPVLHTPLKILLIEDNEIALKITKNLLEDMGYSVDGAEDAAQALALFQPGKYDLIFTDVGLPDIDGYRLTEQFRELEKNAHDPTLKPVPIIALTAHESSDISNKAAASGINAILNKPLSKDDVIKTINQFILRENTHIPAFVDPRHHPEKDEKRFGKKLIDIEEGGSLLGTDDPQGAHKMLEDLILTLPAVRIELEKAYKEKNLDEFFDIVHKFYGGVCYVGTPYLRDAAQELESALVKHETHQINRLYQRMLDEMSAVEKEYNMRIL